MAQIRSINVLAPRPNTLRNGLALLLRAIRLECKQSNYSTYKRVAFDVLYFLMHPQPSQRSNIRMSWRVGFDDVTNPI